jgi:threonyl-tRNA synthetase
MGSIERYISILIEHFAGAFPVWLSPVQVKVLPVTERNADYAKDVGDKLEKSSCRVEIDDRNETLQAKIRNAQLEKVPYMIIVGDKEEKGKTVSLRLRTEKDLGQITLEEFTKRFIKNVAEKSLEL